MIGISQDGERRQGVWEQGRTRTRRWGRNHAEFSRLDSSPSGHGNSRDTTLRGHVLYHDSPVYSTKNTMTAWPAFLGFGRGTKSKEIISRPLYHKTFSVVLGSISSISTGRWTLKGPVGRFIRSCSHTRFGKSPWPRNREIAGSIPPSKLQNPF